jgi:hypothetical protein
MPSFCRRCARPSVASLASGAWDGRAASWVGARGRASVAERAGWGGTCWLPELRAAAAKVDRGFRDRRPPARRGESCPSGYDNGAGLGATGPDAVPAAVPWRAVRAALPQVVSAGGGERPGRSGAFSTGLGFAARGSTGARGVLRLPWGELALSSRATTSGRLGVPLPQGRGRSPKATACGQPWRVVHQQATSRGEQLLARDRIRSGCDMSCGRVRATGPPRCIGVAGDMRERGARAGPNHAKARPSISRTTAPGSSPVQFVITHTGGARDTGAGAGARRSGSWTRACRSSNVRSLPTNMVEAASLGLCAVSPGCC